MSQKGIETEDSVEVDSDVKWRTTRRSSVEICGQHVPSPCNYAAFASCQMACSDI
jgi:hypothetical protein